MAGAYQECVRLSFFVDLYGLCGIIGYVMGIQN